MNVRFSPSYVASVALSNDIRYSILNFSPKWYIPFPRAGHICFVNAVRNIDNLCVANSVSSKIE